MPLQRPSLPPITLISCQSQGTAAPSRNTEAQPTDLRWMVAEEFLKARSLSPSSKRTYEQELKRMYSKLQVSSRAEMVAYLYREC